MVGFDRDEIVRLTEEYGGEWGINHTRRLLNLISIITEGRKYNADVVWIATHLHDWGAYAQWAQPGVDHAIRSRQVAESFLGERGLPENVLRPVLECIEHHHGGDPERSVEAILLSDAYGLDFLGVVGVLRDFSKKPRDLRAGYETAKKRREAVPKKLCLEKSRQIVAKRIEEMDVVFASFERDSFGCF